MLDLYRWFENITNFQLTIEIFHDFPRETSQAPTPPTPNAHMTFLVDKIDLRFPKPGDLFQYITISTPCILSRLSKGGSYKHPLNKCHFNSIYIMKFSELYQMTG